MSNPSQNTLKISSSIPVELSPDITCQSHTQALPLWLQSRVGSQLIEKSELEALRAEMEARSRLELNQKLEEVNAYLEEQAAARERLDAMRDNNEKEMRREFEKYRKELMVSVCWLTGCSHFLLAGDREETWSVAPGEQTISYSLYSFF